MSGEFAETFDPYPTKAPKAKKSRWPIFLGCGCLSAIVMSLGVMGLCVFAYINLTETELELQLRDHPQVQQTLGELEQAEFNFSKTVSVGEDEEVYDLQGSENGGELTVVTTITENGDTVIERASLRVDGEQIELDMSLVE